MRVYTEHCTEYTVTQINIKLNCHQITYASIMYNVHCTMYPLRSVNSRVVNLNVVYNYSTNKKNGTLNNPRTKI